MITNDCGDTNVEEILPPSLLVSPPGQLKGLEMGGSGDCDQFEPIIDKCRR
jgi:hypothetical protein